MTTDFRALCAELADELHDFQWAVQEAGVGWACPDTESLIDRARAALAQPESGRAINWPAYFVRQAAVQEQELKAALAQSEPEGPTEQEWDALVESAWDKYMTVGYQGERFIYERDFDAALGFVREGLARWGNHPGSPDSSGNLKAGLTGSPADGEVAELVTWLRERGQERETLHLPGAELSKQLRTAPFLLTRAADLLGASEPARPKPLSLKEQALAVLEQIPIAPESGVLVSSLDTIRRALEQLDE